MTDGDVKLLFGVDEGSYGGISKDLEHILDKISAKDYKIRIDADLLLAETRIESFRASLKPIMIDVSLNDTGTAVNELTNMFKQISKLEGLIGSRKKNALNLDLSKLNIDKSTADNLNAVVDALSRLTQNKVNAINSLDLTALNNLHIDENVTRSVTALSEAVTKLELLQRQVGTSRSGSSVGGTVSEFKRAKDAVKDYYSLLNEAQRKASDLFRHQSSGLWSSKTYPEMANQLNNALIKMDEMTSKERTLSLSGEQLEEITRLKTASQDKYIRKLEERTVAEQKAAAAEKERAANATQKAFDKKSKEDEKAYYKEVTDVIKEYYDLQQQLVKDQSKGNLPSFAKHLDDVRAKYEEVISAESLDLLNKQHQSEVTQLDAGLERDLAEALEVRAQKQREANQAAEEASVDNVYKNIIDLRKQIGDSELRLFKLDPVKNAEEIEYLRGKISELKNEYSQLLANSGHKLSSEQLERLIQLIDEYKDKKREAEAQRTDRETNEALKEQEDLLQKVIKLQDDIKSGSKSLGGADLKSLQDLSAQLKAAVESEDASRLEDFTAKFERLSSVAGKGLGEASNGLNMLQNRIVRMFSLVEIVRRVWKEIKEMAKAVKELDTAMTQLQVVTHASNSDLSNYGDEIARTSKEIGSSISDMISSTTTYARLGYSLDESSVLAKYTSMLKNVGAIDVSDAQDAVTAISKAFGVGIDDIEGVMDKMVIVGNNFPISVAQIAEGMNNAGSALHAAGNSFEQSVALLTAANTTVQNVSKASTGLRTLTARIRNTKAELDELGEEAITEAKYEEIVQMLTKYNVSLKDLNGEYKSTYEIVRDIANVWDQMTSMEQAALTTQLAGTRQQNVFFSLIEQFKEAEEAMAVMDNSSGALSSSYDIYMDSMQAKTDQFKAAFQDMSKAVLDEDVLGTLVQAGTALISVLGQIAKLFKDIGGLMPLIAGLGSMLLATALPRIIDNWKSLGAAFARLAGTSQEAATGVAKLMSSAAAPGIIGAAVMAVTAIVALVVKINKDAEEARRASAQAAADYQSEIDKSRISIEGYAKEIVDLKEKIESGELSHEGLYEAQSRLLDIKSEMVEMYGEEAESIDILGMKAEDTADKLDGLQQQYERTIASELWAEQGSQMEKAVEQMETARGWFDGALHSTVSAIATISQSSQYYTQIQRALTSITSKYRGVSLLAEDGMHGTIFRLKVEADAEDAKATFTGLLNDLQEMKDNFAERGIDLDSVIDTSLLENNLRDALASANKIIENYVKQRDAYISTRIATNDNFAEIMDNYKDTVEAVDKVLDDANMSSEAKLKAIEENVGNVGSVLASGLANGLFTNDMVIYNYLHDLIVQLEEESKKETLRLQFDIDFENNDRHLKDLTEGWLKPFTTASGEVLASTLDIAMRSSNPSMMFGPWERLIQVMADYGYTQDQIIPKLIEMGLVTDDLTKSIEDQSSAFNTMSIEEMTAATQSAIQIQNKLGESFVQGTHMSKAMFDSLAALVGGEEALSAAVDKDRNYLIKNVDALNELIVASQDALANNIAYGKSFSQFRYHELTKQLYNLVGATDAYDESLRDEIDSTLNDLNNTRLQIEQYRLLEQQLLGVANGFERLNNAKAIDEAADYTDELSGAFDDLVNSFEKHEFGTETFHEAFDTLIPEDVYGQFVDLENQYEAGWDYLTGKLSRYVTKGDKGSTEVTFENAKNFIQDALDTSLGDGLGSVLEGSLENFTLNPQIKTLEQFADSMNVTTEVAFALATAISKYMIGNEDFLDNFDIESFDGKVIEADQHMAELLKKRDQLMREGKIDTSEWEEVNSQIEEANSNMADLQQQALEGVHLRMTIDKDANATDYANKIAEINKQLEEGGLSEEHEIRLRLDKAEYERQLAIILNTPSVLQVQMALDVIQSEIDSAKQELLSKFGPLDENGNLVIKAWMTVEDIKEGNELISHIQDMEEEERTIKAFFEIPNEDEVKGGLKETIELQDEIDKGSKFDIVFKNYMNVRGQLTDIINLLNNVNNGSYTISTGYAKINSRRGGLTSYTGTAHNSGNWGLPSSERDALLGELGAELVVDPRTGKYYTVGDHGAELVDLPKGAIIFNHKQTEELLKNGKIDTRGRALAEGNAHAGVGSATFNMKKFDYATAVAAAVGSAATSATASVAKEIAEEVKDVAEAVDELDDELKETLENMKKEMDEVIGNYEHSIFLLEKTGGSAESQIAIYEEMMKAVNDQANKYRGLGLDDNNDYIQDLQKQWWDYHDKIIDLNADMYDKIIDAHENSMSLREHWIEDAYSRGDKAEAQRLQEEQIAEYEAVQRELHEKAEYYRSLGYKETDDEISELANKWWDYNDKINDIREDMFERMIQEHEDAVSVLENSVTLTENWLDNAESRGDRSGIIKYTNDIVNYYKEMQDEIHRQAEDYRARGYSDLSDEVSALSDKWWEYQRNITDAMSSAFEQIVSEAHNSLDEIQGVYDTLIKASEEYAENGFITVDTFQEIAKMGVQYMSLLRNQNGELVISEQNINAIIAAKTRQLAVDTALDYVQKISTASKNNDITALKNLINATSLATTTTWDLVYAQLYAAGLSGDDYAAARRNIDNMRLLAENAVAGIGQVATTASNATSSASGKANKALQEQKEALDDILKYVKEMIKQEIKDQVDALKEQQKAYKEIVDLQKKSLDLEKEKDSYTKDVKDKTNEIAKLQQKIYMLDLDNSREAQAEKAKLQEDLAKMQGDLADKQADKARDTTKDMLDDMAEAYSKEKDEEIKALEDSISSEEKLYRLAFTKVRINLLNCWKPLRAIYPTA